MIGKIKLIVNYLLLKLRLCKKKGVKIRSIYVSKDIKVEDYVQIPRKVRIAENVKIGKATYISSNTTIESNVTIGRFCSIAPNVFIAPGQHYTDLVTTHPILFNPWWRKKMGLENNKKYINKIGKSEENTIIGNDVWIGLNVIIMRGVKIGDGAIIGAGSVVTKDVEAYSIVGGVPAKHIKYRFNEEKRKELMKLKWWEKEKIDIDYLYKQTKGENL